jgi:hypothetical protein
MSAPASFQGQAAPTPYKDLFWHCDKLRGDSLERLKPELDHRTDMEKPRPPQEPFHFMGKTAGHVINRRSWRPQK